MEENGQESLDASSGPGSIQLVLIECMLPLIYDLMPFIGMYINIDNNDTANQNHVCFLGDVDGFEKGVHD